MEVNEFMRPVQKQLKNRRHALRRAGFTLLELLVVVSIIMILVGILLPSFSNIKRGAKNKKALSDVTAIATAIREYHLEFHKWPGDPEGGVWSNENYRVIANLASNGVRTYFEATSTNMNQALVDPFGVDLNNNSYRIKIQLDAVSVWSCGPDGKDDSGDEIKVSN